MQGIAHRRAFRGCALGALLAHALCSAAVLAHWSFDDNLNDESGAGRHLTASGGAAITTGASRYGDGSLRTDGINDFVYRNDTAFDFGVNDFAISFWYLRGNNDNLDSLLGQGSSFGNDGYHARIDGASDATAQLQIILDDTSGNRAGILAPALDNSAFQHVVMQRTGDVLQIYVNGSLVASDTGNDNVNVSSSTDYAFAIGARNILNGGTTEWQENFFNGWIDEVWVYDRALTAGEISSGYSNNFAAIPEPGTMTSVLVGLALLRFVRSRRSAGRPRGRGLMEVRGGRAL